MLSCLGYSNPLTIKNFHLYTLLSNFLYNQCQMSSVILTRSLSLSNGSTDSLQLNSPNSKMAYSLSPGLPQFPLSDNNPIYLCSLPIHSLNVILFFFLVSSLKCLSTASVS